MGSENIVVDVSTSSQLLAEDVVRAFVVKHALSHRATEDLLGLLHKLAGPDLVAQTRQLPRSSRTLKKRIHAHAAERDDFHGGVIADELSVAGGDIQELFLHFDVARVIDELLHSSTSAGFKIQLQFQPRRVISTGERDYDESFSGAFRRDVEAEVQQRLPGASILSIIFLSRWRTCGLFWEGSHDASDAHFWEF